MAFELDPRIEAASLPLASLPLCEARLQADARWPWIVLIPRRASVREIEALDAQDRAALLDEILLAGVVARAVGEAFGRPVEKLNTGALGNIVAQLHVHVIGRRADDPAWPGPVWGFGVAEPYAEDALVRAVEAGRRVLIGDVSEGRA